MYEGIFYFTNLTLSLCIFLQLLPSSQSQSLGRIFMATIMLFPPAGEKAHLTVVTTTGQPGAPRRGYQWTPPCGRHGAIPASLLPQAAITVKTLIQKKRDYNTDQVECDCGRYHTAYFHMTGVIINCQCGLKIEICPAF